ncbi:LysR family transcriptional regulator [Halomonas sp. YLB-10]|uniref:LysR family transcriptional regulator n=1 Tax=unclassified Halomonas TaxID=2609666 RepID=UPI000F5E6363|nr:MULTISPECIES: LysR family transcriptional regulator [unclassified Halomonas]RQW68646.1 LysR family transcriptional regulator [Halomonas sp. YLB-10]
MRSVISQLSIHKLEVFCAVAELKSVSLAAVHLNIAQPVVSTHLKSLSDKLGVTLTARSGRRIELTEEGQRVYGWALDVVVRTRELEREIADTQRGVSGKVSVGASMTLGSYVLPGIIASIHQRYPRGEISVRVMTSLSVTDAVRQGECDFAFTILDPRHEINDLEIEHVRDERLILAAADHFAVQAASTSLNDLAYITAQLGTPRRDIEEYLLMEYGVSRRRILMEFGHPEAIKRAVRTGVGVAFLFHSSIHDELVSGSLRRIDTPGMDLRVPLYLIRRKNKNLNRFQSTMIEEITRSLREQNS